MPFGFGGARGRGAGRGRGFRGLRRIGRFGPPGGRRPPENCICPNCGMTLHHKLGLPCFQTRCPKCGFPNFIILKLSNNSVEIEDFYLNKFLEEKRHIGVKVIKSIIRYKLDLLFTPRIGEISFHMLKNSFVDIYKAAENESVQDIIEKYRNKQVTQITEPTHSIEDSQSSV